MVGGTGTGRTGYWKSGVWVEDIADPAEFLGVGVAVGEFDGIFIGAEGTGAFFGVGSGVGQFVWTPFVGGGISDAVVKDTPASVLVKSRPGDVVIVDGVAGTVVVDVTGRLVVIDHAGEVLCIIGPAGVILP